MLYRMIGGIKWIRRGAGREEAAVSREEIFKAKVRGEMTGGEREAFVVMQAVASEHERLWLVSPRKGFDVETPEIPVAGGNVGAVGIQMLGGECSDFGGTGILRAKIPFRERRLGGANRLHDELRKAVLCGGQW